MSFPTIHLEYVTCESYDQMELLYNSAYHSDMNVVGQSTHDGMESWYNEDVGNLMRRKPWGFVSISTMELRELLELGFLSQFRSLSDKRLLESDSVCSVMEKIDDVITENCKMGVPIFCRLNECSMKKNVRGTVIPFSSSIEIIRYMLEDHRVYGWLSNSTTIRATRFILSDFDKSVQIENEFRVFVYKGRVTGISPYRWYKFAKEIHIDTANTFSNHVINFIEKKLVNALNREDATFVVDIICDDLTDEQSISLIEINRFGGETGCGSALFHWKNNEKELYNTDGIVHVRLLQE